MKLCHEVIGKSIIKSYKLFSEFFGDRKLSVNPF